MDNRTDKEKLDFIRDALEECRIGKITLFRFALWVNFTINPCEPTPEDLKWGYEKAKELGLIKDGEALKVEP